MALPRTRWGVALIAIGADEERAETLGVATTRVKIGVFALSAASMGAIGGGMAPPRTHNRPHGLQPPVSLPTPSHAPLRGPPTRARAHLGRGIPRPLSPH